MEKQSFDKVERLKTGARIALMSPIMLFFLALMKIIVGYRFNSQLLIADAFHSGADILINLTSLLGLWLASRIKSIKFRLVYWTRFRVSSLSMISPPPAS